SSRRAVAESEPDVAPGAGAPTLTVLVAARDERAALPRTLDALLAQDPPAERILVIDDGSTDGTAALLAERYGDAVTVLRRPGAGKARALNAALPLCTTDLIVTLDADTVLEPGALAAVRRAFAARPGLAAACGVLRPVCQGGRLASAFELYQRFGSLPSFVWRGAGAREQPLVLVSGASALSRRAPLVDVGGFDPSSKVEDYELLFRLHRASRDRGRELEVAVVR